jgi:hypothetical protein
MLDLTEDAARGCAPSSRATPDSRERKAQPLSQLNAADGAGARWSPRIESRMGAEASSMRAPNTSREAGGILSYFTRHRTAANLLLVVLLAAGAGRAAAHAGAVLSRCDRRQSSAFVTWDGAGAEDVDGAIVQVLEPPSGRGGRRKHRHQREGPRQHPAGIRARAGTWRAPPTTCRPPSTRSPTCPRMPRSPRCGAALARPGDRRGDHRTRGRPISWPLSPMSW